MKRLILKLANWAVGDMVAVYTVDLRYLSYWTLEEMTRFQNLESRTLIRRVS